MATIEQILAAHPKNSFEIYNNERFGGRMLQCCLRVWNGRRMVEHVSNCSDRQKLIDGAIDWFKWLEPEYEEHEATKKIDGKNVKFYTIDGMWTCEYFRVSEGGCDFIRQFKTLDAAVKAAESLFAPATPEEIKRAVAKERRNRLVGA
jgi:hypothetical protein